MKKIGFALIIFSVFHSMGCYAQNWREMINDPASSFEETRNSFYQEFGDEQGGKGTGWKQFKRWEWFIEPRLSESGELPDPRQIYQEVKKAQLQKQYRGASGDWQLMGPIDEPQNNDGRSIGRVSAIAFHPADTNQIFAGAPSGGVWKSTDNGQSWNPLTDDLPNIGVSEIVINPHHPDTMYISTGDDSASDTYTFGVMKSVDGGQTWDTTGLSFGVAQGKNIRRMILDSTNTNVLLAATTGGIFRTADAGSTWQLVKSGRFCDIEFKPYSPDTVYATTNSGSSPAFYVSHDNGLTWNTSINGLNSSAMRRVKVAVSPASPNVVYVLASAANSSYQGLYRSDDAGENWTLMSDSPNLMAGDEYGDDTGGQGWYSMELAVSPIDADEVWVGGINLWKSTDGGTTFLLDAHWYGANGIYIHADQHRLMFHPGTGQFYVGCDGGLYRRSHYYNGYESISTQMSITQFYRLATARTDASIIMAGAQDNGTFRWKNNLWMAVNGGDGMEAMIDPTNDLVMYSTTQNGSLYKSTNGGNTFGQNISPADGAWVTPYMIDPTDPEVLYAAPGSKVYRSEDGGGTWWEFSPNITNLNSGPLIMLDIAQSNNEHVVAGSGRTISITTDLGGSWQNILPGLPGQSMTYVAFDPLDDNTLWVTFSGYSAGNKVYRSTDAGQTWENMSMNLPNLPVNCVEIERSTTGGVYVGTDVGVYYWDRTLTEWEPFMTGLPNVIVNELEIHEPSQRIVAATFGRGIWESGTRNFLNVGISSPIADTDRKLTLWPNPTTGQIHVEFNQSIPSDMNIIDAYGRTVMTNLNPEKKMSATISIHSLSNGVYYLSDPDNRLLGRFIMNNN